MKIISKKLNKNLIVVQTETLDDLWVLYNLIAVGDIIDGKTSRRVVVTDRPDDKGERKYIFLRVKVESIEFHEFSNRLRVKGRIVEGPEDLVTLNTYHTFNIEENTRIGIQKESWNSFALKILEDAAKQKVSQRLLVVAIDSGEATFGEIGDYYQKTSLKVSEHVPGKRFGNVKDSVNARNKFFAAVLKNIESMMSHTSYSKILIVGPGFVREQFMTYAVAKNPELKPVLVTEAVSSASEAGIRELLHKDIIRGLLKDSRILEESRLVDEFLARLGKDSGDVAYGMEELQKAAEIGAIEDLLLTDEMMRRINAGEDKQVLSLMRLVEQNRGKIHILSTLHDAGKRIKGFGGIAAILRFKLSY